MCYYVCSACVTCGIWFNHVMITQGWRLQFARWVKELYFGSRIRNKSIDTTGAIDSPLGRCPGKKKGGAPWAHRSSRAPLAPMPFGLSFRFVFLRSAWLGFTIGAFTIGTVWCTGASQVMMCCWRGKVLDTVYRGRGLRAPCSSQNSDELYEILFHSRTPTHVPSGFIDPKLL